MKLDFGVFFLWEQMLRNLGGTRSFAVTRVRIGAVVSEDRSKTLQQGRHGIVFP